MHKVLIFVLLLMSTVSFGQIEIGGTVQDQNQVPIPYANVVIQKDSLQILNFMYTDEAGVFQLEVPEKGVFQLFVSCLGYKAETIQIDLQAEEQQQVFEIVLPKESFVLHEVIVQADIPIKEKKDTIVIDADMFANGNEEVVEDLLKKIPGVTVNSDGTIKVGNKEIEKLMVEGDDFFEKGYKLLSKNMPAYAVDKVELLQNYSNNRLLKDVERSDKVALNLKLKEEARHIWFGNVDGSYGFAEQHWYHLRANLMNFGTKNKFFFFTNLNNVAYDATGDINHLIRPIRYDEPASIGDDQQVRNLLNLQAPLVDLQRDRTHFNNAELLSLNAIFRPSKKMKAKVLGFYNGDEIDFFRNATEVVSVNGTQFTNTEDYQLRTNNRIGFGELDIEYDISKTQMLEATTKYNHADENTASNLLFNGASTVEALRSNNRLFDQKISYSHRFNNKKVLLLTGRFIDEQTPQQYAINQFFYQDLFPAFSNANNVVQQSKNKMQFAGLETHLLDRHSKNHLLEMVFGNAYRKDILETQLGLKEDDIILENLDEYKNQTTYQSNNLYFKSKYVYELKKFSLIGKLNFHQLFNQLTHNFESENQSPFFVNPSVGLDWEINDKHEITTSYSYNTSNAGILDVYNDFVLTGFRAFSRGLGTFNQLDASTFTLNYELGDWGDRFFATTSIVYSQNHDFFSTNTRINQNHTQSEKIIIDDRQSLSITSKWDYYVKQISANLKLDLGFSQSEFKNIVNNSNLRTVNSSSYTYGLELRSGFTGAFNYHIGTKWTTTEIQTSIRNSFTNNNSFLNLSFLFQNNLNIQVRAERYFFDNLETDNTYYFLDLDARYTIKENKLTLALSGKNLLNTKRFRNFAASDIGTSVTEFRLLPRFVLLKMEYRL
ncbi:MAG: TonB-dependent receptor [Bacteroidota bacterium]